MIMFPNGVTHMLTQTHMESVKKALSWLSFVPSSTKSHLPVLDMTGLVWTEFDDRVMIYSCDEDSDLNDDDDYVHISTVR